MTTKYTPSELSVGLIRFKVLKPRTYETGYCAKILEKDNMIHHHIPNARTGEIFWELTPDELLNCREAYFGGKYEEQNAWLIAVSISAIVNAALAVVIFLVSVYQSPDSGLQKLQLELIRQKDVELKAKMEEIDSLQKILKVLTTPDSLYNQKPDSLQKGAKPN